MNSKESYLASFGSTKGSSEETENSEVVSPEIQATESNKLSFEIAEIPEAPQIEFINLTASEIKAKADNELKAVLSGEVEPDKSLSSSLRSLIELELTELVLVNTSQPHWTTSPNSWLFVASVIFSGVSLILGWLTYSPGNKPSSPSNELSHSSRPDVDNSKNSPKTPQNLPVEQQPKANKVI